MKKLHVSRPLIQNKVSDYSESQIFIPSSGDHGIVVETFTFDKDSYVNVLWFLKDGSELKRYSLDHFISHFVNSSSEDIKFSLKGASCTFKRSKTKSSSLEKYKEAQLLNTSNGDHGIVTELFCFEDESYLSVLWFLGSKTEKKKYTLSQFESTFVSCASGDFILAFSEAGKRVMNGKKAS
ncbi:MAG: hypothetical protein GY909_15280 [Oligoflexia bacterium]|nr:hypothetical protein [Oligoflexia bacterium]